jgi:predicted TIM-barrel fold metal-dependent hydrolase
MHEAPLALWQWLPEAALRRKVFVDNAARLYRF